MLASVVGGPHPIGLLVGEASLDDLLACAPPSYAQVLNDALAIPWTVDFSATPRRRRHISIPIELSGLHGFVGEGNTYSSPMPFWPSTSSMARSLRGTRCFLLALHPGSWDDP